VSRRLRCYNAENTSRTLTTYLVLLMERTIHPDVLDLPRIQERIYTRSRSLKLRRCKTKILSEKIQHRKCSKPQTIVGKAVIHTVRSDADIVSDEFEYVRVDSGGSKKQVLDGVHIGATWRIRLNRPSAMACGVFVKLL